MTYTIADIHGEYYKFMSMLNLIDFQESDTMYILGDAIDRGKYSTRTLLYIMNQANMKMLLGNHESMMLDSLNLNAKIYDIWQYNGGDKTEEQYLQLSEENRRKIYSYLKTLPLTIELDNYILVHAGINKTRKDKEFCLWAREDFLDCKVDLDKTVIFGHTPTYFMTGVRKNMSIWYGEGRIGIDCGACFKGGRLGCLRLDDMKEFYV
jgi:serine/threonine protein phosphatase 1